MPFRQVWTKPPCDFDGVSFLDVWVSYDGEPSDLDARLLNSFDVFLMEALRREGINAIPLV